MKPLLFDYFPFLSFLGLISGVFMITKRQRKVCFITTATFALLAGLVFCPTASAHSVSNNTTVTGKPTPPEDMRILIVRVDLANNQVTVNYKNNNIKHVYTIDGGTSVVVYGRPASLSDITVGTEVKNYVERDSTTLDSIEVDKASPAPKLAKQ